ncbi:MAG TPA: transketolase, partial [Candidatus Nanoarchaeia archaeon]|nr:transketolase [Candidatus Nanoarchaeia archaeon]
MADEATVAKLKEKAKQLRIQSVKLVYQAGSGHPGGSLSAADIVAVLFYHAMRYDAKRPDW